MKSLTKAAIWARLSIDFDNRTDFVDFVGFERIAVVDCSRADCSRADFANSQKFGVVNNTDYYCKHCFDNADFKITVAEIVDNYLHIDRIAEIVNFVAATDYGYFGY